METELKRDASNKLRPSLNELNKYIEKYSKAIGAKMPNLDDDYAKELKKMSNAFQLYYAERSKLIQENKWYRKSSIVRDSQYLGKDAPVNPFTQW